MARMPKIILSGLDVGSSKTVALIAGFSSGAMQVLGLGEAPPSGMDKGIPSGSDALITSILTAFKDAEKAAGIKAPLVYAGCDSANGVIRPCRAVPGNFFIDIPDSERVLCLLPPKHPFASPKDGNVVEARAVTASAGEIVLFLSCLKKAGLNPAELVYTPLAGAAALISAAEKEVGVVLIDIGASKTSASYFSRGFLKDTAVLPICGEHFIGDLAVGLRTTMGEARRVAAEYSRVTGAEGRERNFVVGSLDGKEKKGVTISYIRNIIEARIQEFAEIIADLFEDFGCSDFLPGGVVLAGGGAQLPGLAGWMERRLHVSVRAGRVDTAGAAISPLHYNAFGLAKYGLSGPAAAGKKSSNIFNSNFWTSLVSEKAARFLRID